MSATAFLAVKYGNLVYSGTCRHEHSLIKEAIRYWIKQDLIPHPPRSLPDGSYEGIVVHGPITRSINDVRVDAFLPPSTSPVTHQS